MPSYEEMMAAAEQARRAADEAAKRAAQEAAEKAAQKAAEESARNQQQAAEAARRSQQKETTTAATTAGNAPVRTVEQAEQAAKESAAAQQQTIESARRAASKVKVKVVTPPSGLYPVMENGEIIDLTAPSVVRDGPIDRTRQTAARTAERRQQQKIIEQIKRDDPEGYEVFQESLRKNNNSFRQAIKDYNKDVERRHDAYVKQTAQNQLLNRIDTDIYAREAAAWNVRQQRYEAAEKELSGYKIKTGGKAFYDGEWHDDFTYDMEKYLKDNKDKRKEAVRTLVNAGFSRAAINDAAYYADLNLGQKVWQGLTPWDESKGETVSVKGAAVMAGDLILPGFYTIRSWDKMSDADKLISIGIDVVSLIPFGFAAARGARVVGTGARAARLAMAGKYIAREALAQVRGPIDLIIHPLGTAKTTFRQVQGLVETFNRRKLPEMVLTTSNKTVRIKVSELRNADDALKARAKLMEAAMRGETPIVEIGDQIIELRRSPLMRELGGGAAHATPMGEAFEAGIKVAEKPGMPLSEQGLFLSHEPLPGFTEMAAFGGKGEKGVLLIFSPETAAKYAKDTGKIYKSPMGAVVEAERKFPVGFEAETKNWQKLYTRIGPEGRRVEIWLEKPLTTRQIAKLKAQNLAEVIKAPFAPPVKIKGKGALSIADDITGLTPRQVDELARVLRRSGNAYQARALVRAYTLARAERIADFSRVVSGKRPASRTTSTRTQTATVSRTDRTTTPVRDAGGRFTSRADTTRTIDESPRRDTPDTDRTTRTPETPRIDRTDTPERPERPPESPTRPPTVPDIPGRPPRVPDPERPPRRPPDDPDSPGKPPRTPDDPPDDGGKKKHGFTEQPEWSRKDIESAIAWRDGVVVHAIRSPYRRGIDEATFSVKNLPDGLKVLKQYTGKGSQARSITFINKSGKIDTGKLPKRLTVDVGNQDVIITKKKRGISIRHVSDRGTRTTSKLTISRTRNLSKKKGRVYHTRAAGGTIISRRGIRGR